MKLSDRKDSQILSDLLPYLFFDEPSRTLWLRDGSAVKVLSVIPKNVLSATEEELESLRAGLSGVANQLPEGTLLQIWFSREETNAKTDEAVKRWIHSHSTEEKASPGQTQLYDAKLTTIKTQWESNAIFQTKIYVSVRVIPETKPGPMGKLGPLAFLTFGRRKKKEVDKPISLIAQELQETYQTLKLGLESHGFEITEPDFQELAKVLYRFFNPERASTYMPERIGTEGCHDLSEAVALTDLIETKQGINLGRTGVRIGSVKTLPEFSYPGVMTALASEVQPFVLVMTIMVLSQTKERERLSRRQRLTTGMASGNHVRNLSAESQLQDIEETLTSMISSGEKLFATSMQLIVHESQGDNNYRFQQLINSAERIGSGSRWFEETVGAYPVFFGILPFAPTFITRPKRILTSQLTDFFPIYGIGHGHEDATVIFETPYQSLIGFSLFEKSPAANAIVIGSTGSGKSTLVCGLLLGMIARAGKESPPCA